ncbi:hypothetical protein BKA69DRAFT_776266 [Paraphysoderma sedebokerense]|nr:hypothetical protein BKA69DRAFT_776266 [Paraphysoderma sedebokerense]
MTILTSIFCPRISSFNIEEPISCVIACYPLLFLFLLAIIFDILVSRYRSQSGQNKGSKSRARITNVEIKSVSKIHSDCEELSSEISVQKGFSSNQRQSVTSKSTISMSNAPNQSNRISNHSTSKTTINPNINLNADSLTATSHSTITSPSSANINPLSRLPVTLFICTKCRRQSSCVTVNTGSENTPEIEDIVSVTPASSSVSSKQQKPIKSSSTRTTKVVNDSDSVSTLVSISTSTVDQAQCIDQSPIKRDFNAISSTSNVGTIASSSSHPSLYSNTSDTSILKNGSLFPHDKSTPSVTSNVESATKTVQVHHSRVDVEIETKKSGQVLFDRIHEFVSATSEPQNGLRSHNFINDNTQDEESQGGSESDELSRILRNYLKIGKLQIQPVQCLSTCAQANVVALSHPLRYTYQFGSLHEFNPTHITDLLAFTKFYVEDEDGLGFSKTKTRPGVLKKGLLSRVPPLTGCLEIQNVGNLNKFGTEKAEDDSSGKLRLPSNNGSENISARNRSRSLSFSNSGGVSKEFKVLGNICECGKEKIY